MKHPLYGHLTAFVKGELEKTEEAEITRHLAVCGECLTLKEKLELLYSELKTYEPAQKDLHDKQFTARIMLKIENQKQPWRFFDKVSFAVFDWLAPSIACVAGIFLIFLYNGFVGINGLDYSYLVNSSAWDDEALPLVGDVDQLIGNEEVLVSEK